MLYSGLNYIGALASGVWDELGDPSSVSVQTISGWFMNNIGRLNNYLMICTAPATGDVAASGYLFYPMELTPIELDIYAMLYEYSYYNTQIANVYNNISSVSSMFRNLKEGDSAISRDTPLDAAKAMKALRDQLISDIKWKSSLYRIGQANPQNVNSIIYAIYGNNYYSNIAITI